jgi:two-component system CheB/CheR fusion protein
MFGQAPARALSGKGGLGIGLALVRQLVERHNGRIAVHSDGIGKGASFSVWLPRFSYATLGAAPADETSPESGRWQGVKVLIADDAAEAIGALAQLLEMEGAQVTVAHDGAEALARFRENPTDIVFADIGMPNMDGYEFARHLREISGDGRVPLVAMTGFTRSNDVDRALKAGFDAHIGKPLSIGQLTATMQRLLPERGGGGADSGNRGIQS